MALKKCTGGGGPRDFCIYVLKRLCLFYEKKIYPPLRKLNGKILNLVVDLLP